MLLLLNLLNDLGKAIKCEACRAFYCFFATSLINSILLSKNVRFYLSYDIKTILKSCIGVKMLGFYHMPDVKSVISSRFPKICKPLVVYRFKCMALFHSQA